MIELPMSTSRSSVCRTQRSNRKGCAANKPCLSETLHEWPAYHQTGSFVLATAEHGQRCSHQADGSPFPLRTSFRMKLRIDGQANVGCLCVDCSIALLVLVWISSSAPSRPRLSRAVRRSHALTPADSLLRPVRGSLATCLFGSPL